jgi:hypothetical protein
VSRTFAERMKWGLDGNAKLRDPCTVCSHDSTARGRRHAESFELENGQWIASAAMTFAGIHAAVTIDWSNQDIPRAILLGVVIIVLPTNYERHRLTRLIEKQSTIGRHGDAHSNARPGQAIV